MQVIIALLVLGLIILVHELGHFLSAKYFKMPVSEFSIGMGPHIYSYEGSKTMYSIRSIPMGGFVKIDGMDVDSVVEDGFNSKPPLQRFVVLFAGVFMNFLLAMILIFTLIMIEGKATPNDTPTIRMVADESKAKNILLPKDTVLSIDGKQVTKWDELSAIMKAYTKDTSEKEKTVKMVIVRNGEQKTLDVPLSYDGAGERFYLGVMQDYTLEKYSFGSAIVETGKEFYDTFKSTLSGYKMLITGKVSTKQVSGPIGIVKVVGEFSQQGLGMLAALTIMLSINIGILNLLPLPALDGGRIIFVILEMCGIKVNKKIEEKVHTAGMFLLFALIIFVTGNDVFNMMSN